MPAKEYASIPWEKYERGDPAFLNEIYRRIAFREGELGDAFAEGGGRLAARWKFPPEYLRRPRERRGGRWATRATTPRKRAARRASSST